MVNQTPYLSLTLPDFDQVTWHDEVNTNFTIIDAAIAAFNSVTVSGIWLNSSSYSVGQHVIDVNDLTIWEVLVAHTSPPTGTFLDYRTNNPTHWTLHADIIAVANAAAASAAAAETSYDSFDDRYLGPKTSDPTLDNDGNALLTGALYFNTSVNEMRVYTGAVWIPVSSGGGGGVTDGDKGEITVSGVGTVWTIDPDVVTFAKMQNINTDRLIGRDTAATGDPEEITVGGGLEFTGTGSIQRAALTGDVTATAGSNATTIANNAVSNVKLRDSVGLSVIGRSANTTGDPADIVGTDGQVLRVSGTTLGFGTIVTTGIADDAVTFAKTQNIATDRLLGRDTVGTGDIEEISLNATLEFTGLSGIQRAALTGDITAAAGSNATTIANNVVTFAKMQTIATDSLLGRDTAATGNVENITLNATLSMTGTGALQRAALTGDITAAAGSNTTVISNNAVSNSALRDSGALSVIGRATNTTGDPADISATAGSDAVLRESGSGLGFGTVATGGLANNAVTFAKMQTIATDSLLGRDTAATGNVENITLNATLSMTGAGALQREALTGDVTASAGSNATTIAINVITDAKLRDSAGLSVIGRSANSSGDPADIVGTDGNVLRVSGTTLGFGTVATAGIADDAVTNAKLANAAAWSIKIRNAGTSGDLSDAALADFTEGLTPATGDFVIGFLSTGEIRKYNVGNLPGGGGGSYTDEQAQDAIGSILLDSATIDFTYDDVTPNITAIVINDSITFAKMQNITTDRLLGRDTAASGDVEEISLNATLEFTGSGGIQRAALTGDVTASAGSNATTIANNAVTTAKISDNQITFAKLAAGSISHVTVRAATTANITISTALNNADTLDGVTLATGDLVLVKNQSTTAQNGIYVVGVSPARAVQFNTYNSHCGSVVTVQEGTTNADSIYVCTSNAGGTLDTTALTYVILAANGLEFNSGGIRRSALTGDVTATAGSNATTISNDVVTFAKMQNIATDRLIGRDTAAAGDPEEITVSNGLEFTGAGGIQIANAGVTLAKMADIATDSLIGRDTAGTGVPENILLNATLSMDGTGNLQRAALTGDVTASAGSNATTIANNAVTTAKIADAQVTFAKIGNIGTDTLIGRDTAGSGAPESIALGNGLQMTGAAAIEVNFASQATQEAGSSTTSAVSSGRQHFHPSAAKAWVLFDGTGTPAITTSYGGSSITDGGTGVYTVNLAVTFSSANFCTCCGAGLPQSSAAPASTTTVSMTTRNNSGTLTDTSLISLACFGDF